MYSSFGVLSKQTNSTNLPMYALVASCHLPLLSEIEKHQSARSCGWLSRTTPQPCPMICRLPLRQSAALEHEKKVRKLADAKIIRMLHRQSVLVSLIDSCPKKLRSNLPLAAMICASIQKQWQSFSGGIHFSSSFEQRPCAHGSERHSTIRKVGSAIVSPISML